MTTDFNPTNLTAFWGQVTHDIDAYLEGVLKGWDDPCLKEAAVYMLKGGKRLRPLLVMASGYILGIDSVRLIPLAASIECLHAFSLVHDDLPGLDNDDTRRGMPSAHKAFGEGTAILLGDALLVLALDILLSDPSIPRAVIQALSSSTLSMIHGQALDIQGHKTPASMALKTGAIMLWCVAAPAIVAGASEDVYKALMRYAQHFGLLYQVADDWTDGEEGPYFDIQMFKREAWAALDGLEAEKTWVLRDLIEWVYQKACDAKPKTVLT